MTNLTVNLLHIEAVFVKVTLPNKTIIVSSIYKPPNTKFDDFKTCMNKSLLSLSQNETDIIICGDFNLDLLKLIESSNNASTFYDDIKAMALIPTICKPNRLTNSSGTLIDYMFVSNLQSFVSGIFTIDISGHLPIFLYRKIFSQLTDFLPRILLID